ncbi:MAG: CD1247 N-terminal domain-containing protein [Bacillota bacterium]
MKDLRKRVAYLQGLMAGIDMDANSREGRIFSEVVGVLHDVAETLAELKVNQEDLDSYVESLGEELQELEDHLLEAQDYVEVQCPECHDLVCFDSDVLDDDDIIEVTCPNCDTVVFVNDQDYELIEDPDVLVLSKSEEEDF